MPLYEYECDACAHRFEKIQKFSDPLVDVCPKCSGHVRKLLSSPAIQFKGSGWYITDYAKKSGNVESSSASSSKSDSSSKNESGEKQSDSSDKSSKSTESSDSKPAAAPAKSDG